MKFKEKIIQLEHEISILQCEIKNLNRIYNYFPDLEISTINKNEKIYSKMANSKTDKVHIYRSCQCCAEATIYASPYLEIEDFKIYSNPHFFILGDGLKEEDKWEKEMKRQNIPEIIIEECKTYIKNTIINEEYD
jgi:hypothetical protein